MTLTEFLLARIAEDEADARALGVRTPWSQVSRQGVGSGGARGMLIASCHQLATAHIVRHDPSRVLAECEAKRRIVEEYVALAGHGGFGDADWVLPLLALPYSDHPDYDESWRP